MIIKGYADASTEVPPTDQNCLIILDGHPEVVKEVLRRIRKCTEIELCEIEGISVVD